MRLRDLLLCCLFVGAFALRASAAPIFFTDRAAWEAAANPNVLLTFDTFQPLEPGALPHTFGTTYADIFRISGDITGAGQVYNGGPGGLQLIANTGFGAGTTAPVWAFGVDVTPLMCGNCVTPEATFTVGPVRMENVTAPQFIGIVFDTPTVVSVAPGIVRGLPGGLLSPSQIFVDNVAVTTVPEPATLLLLSMGLCVTGYSRNRTTRRR
jgi:hypothetical protein